MNFAAGAACIQTHYEPLQILKHLTTCQVVDSISGWRPWFLHTKMLPLRSTQLSST